MFHLSQDLNEEFNYSSEAVNNGLEITQMNVSFAKIGHKFPLMDLDSKRKWKCDSKRERERESLRFKMCTKVNPKSMYHFKK